jgi:hypothetical protein
VQEVRRPVAAILGPQRGLFPVGTAHNAFKRETVSKCDESATLGSGKEQCEETQLHACGGAHLDTAPNGNCT